MGLQKYHTIGEEPEKLPNGSIACRGHTWHGTHLALVRNCPIYRGGEYVQRLTAYVQGEPDTFFSIPAAVKLKGKTVRGHLTIDETGFSFYMSKF